MHREDGPRIREREERMGKQKSGFCMRPLARKENVLQGEKWRITLLTSRLVRLEYSEEGIFEDRPTQTVWNRDFEPVSRHMLRQEGGIEIFTEHMQISYDEKAFSSNGLSAVGPVGANGGPGSWHYGDTAGNLKGTARTLDEADGACPLQDGILSEYGYAVLDDSKSLILTEDGWIRPRSGKCSDLYLFYYGKDYEGALSDYYRLTGKTPMLPRFALGNWWSRYYEYSEESYRKLMNRFEEEKIPFTVAVIDMDWHLVKEVDEKYGSGWTGFTWNRTLFPDPKGFLSWLHEKGLHTTLNLHPASGIRAYEERYPQIAEEMGVDTEKEEPVPFDIANRKFLDAYFTHILHPLEEEGVDFWWIDWQQGNNTKVQGLDPLWMLNHYHYLDSARNGKRPMTFSRYAGPGSHRYPIGFSGDTVISWESLDFQPYFTNTASNIGYGWWSHDIGGHMKGYRDNILEARWVQYGVFSPVNRLHSTKNEFNSKEPWNFPEEIHHVMNEFLRLRHRLIPYLYTMNHRAYAENKPLVEPMYYRYPQAKEAYQVKNQYSFGTELLVAPITTPMVEKVNRGKVCMWIPEGIYVDFFTGMLYSGGRMLAMYRDIHSIPVLARAGAIVPMTEEIFGTMPLENPRSLAIHVFAGADGRFTLYEDDNETEAYRDGICALTKLCLDWKKGTFTIGAAEGTPDLIPEKRSYTVCFHGVKETEVTVLLDGTEIPAECRYEERRGSLSVTVRAIPVTKKLQVILRQGVLRANPVKEEVFEFLNQAEISFEEKQQIYEITEGPLSTAGKLSALQAMNPEPDVTGCVTELLTAWEGI